MKKLLLGIILMALVFVFPMPTMAGVDVGISISLPPLIFPAPPVLVVLPETNVYVAPDVDVDIFFYNGWWWRPWEGRWYRSRNYRSGWGYYQSVPSFYREIPSGWRNDYREHRWRGHQWNHQRVPHQQVQRNWRSWEKNRHWEKKNTWGVQGLKPQPRSQHPSRAVQPHPQARPQQARQQSRKVQPQHPQQRSQMVKPQSRQLAKPQQPRPQSRKVQTQHSQPQKREAPRQSHPQQEKPERGGGHGRQ